MQYICEERPSETISIPCQRAWLIPLLYRIGMNCSASREEQVRLPKFSEGHVLSISKVIVTPHFLKPSGVDAWSALTCFRVLSLTRCSLLQCRVGQR